MAKGKMAMCHLGVGEGEEKKRKMLSWEKQVCFVVSADCSWMLGMDNKTLIIIGYSLF